MNATDPSELSMQELFLVEAESQTNVLTNGLLALERDPVAPDQLEACMRAAHSLKGAARIVDIDAGVSLAHAMEDFLVAAQKGRIVLERPDIDLLFRGVDLMIAIARTPDRTPGSEAGTTRPKVDAFVAELGRVLVEREAGGGSGQAQSEKNRVPRLAGEQHPQALPPDNQDEGPRPNPGATPVVSGKPPVVEVQSSDRALRVTVENLNRLLGLAGETLVESRWIKPFGQSLSRLKRLNHESVRALDSLRDALATDDERVLSAVTALRRSVAASQHYLAERLEELDASDRRYTSLAQKLYDQALACRMRPFSDGIGAFGRMARDLARSLGKELRFEVIGETTPVDRDVLEKLESPISHLLRNAVDHGLETPDERRAAGKPAEGLLQLQAYHASGALQVIVSDDGRGIDSGRLRQAVVERGLTTSETAARLTESELTEFLFLPGFSMKGEVTEISGRGVGLDVVRDMLAKVRGTVRIFSEVGRGTQFHLSLPLTLSVVRTLLVEIGGESYAFPLSRIVRAVKMSKDKVATFEGRQYFVFDNADVGLVAARQIFADLTAQPQSSDELSVVVVGDQSNRYGLVVDRLIGGAELVVHPLDERLGKVKDISAAALSENGSPLLIVDVDDLILSMEKLAHADSVDDVRREPGEANRTPHKRVLVVDDSLTVREIERKLLEQGGYQVEVAVDGMDGWNAVRAGKFDLIVTDIDMPRLDGIELVTRIRADANLKSLPVMILSYKDREEDRRRGLEAGADYYLTKSSFKDDTLLTAVVDLIGEAAA